MVLVKMPTSTSLLVTKITKIYSFRPAAAVQNGLKSGKYLQSWVWQSVRNRKGFTLIFISYWYFEFGLSVIWLITTTSERGIWIEKIRNFNK